MIDSTRAEAPLVAPQDPLTEFAWFTPDIAEQTPQPTTRWSPESVGWLCLNYAVAMVLGIIWGSLLGAEVGVSSVVMGIAAGLALAVVYGVCSRSTGVQGAAAGLRRRRLISFDMFIAMTVLALTVFGAVTHETVVGGRDPDVYVNTAIRIATHRELLYVDQTLAALDVKPGDFVFGRTPAPWIRPGMPGYQVVDFARFVFEPHGFHAWPAFLATGFGLFGWAGVLWLPILLRGCGLGLLALIARASGGRWVALVAVVLLGSNVGALWYGRSHAAEILVQFLFLAGLLFGIRALRHRSSGDAVLAGTAFGLVHLTKIEYIQLPLFFALIATALIIRGWRWQAVASFIVPYALAVVHSAIHALSFAPAYTVGQVMGIFPRLDWTAFDRSDPVHPFTSAFWADVVRSNVTVAVGLTVAILVLASASFIGCRWGQRIEERRGRFPAAFVLTATITVVLLLLLSRTAALAATDDGGILTMLRGLGNPDSIRDVALYLGAPAFALGGLGLVLAVRSARDFVDRVALAFVVVAVSPLLFVNWLADDHFWAGRRYVPMLLPAFAWLVAFGVVRATGWLRDLAPWRPLRSTVVAVGSAVCCFLVVLNVRTTLPVLGIAENAGAISQLRLIAGSLPRDGVILVPWDGTTGFFLTPLVVWFDLPLVSIEASRSTTPEMAAFMTRLQRSGKSLYWLGPAPPDLPDGATSTALSSFTLGMPRAESPRARLPARVEWLSLPLDLFRIDSVPATR